MNAIVRKPMQVSNRHDAVQARHEAFKIALRSNGGNATQAAIEAGYSPKTAHVIGSQLLRRLKLTATVEARSLEIIEKSLLSEERITKELERIALFDPRKLFGQDGRILAPHEWSDDVAAGISSIDRDEITSGSGSEVVGQTSKIRLWDKLQALNAAMKMRGMYEKDNRQRSEAIAISVQFSANPEATGDQRAGDTAVDITTDAQPPTRRDRGKK